MTPEAEVAQAAAEKRMADIFELGQLEAAQVEDPRERMQILREYANMAAMEESKMVMGFIKRQARRTADALTGGSQRRQRGLQKDIEALKAEGGLLPNLVLRRCRSTKVSTA